ncbi:MAG: redox-regulated ATPase YchF [Limnochordaceae bacterium]|nr:redox-regulated ATPase YchF [Limnochordaceae bacterium]
MRLGVAGLPMAGKSTIMQAAAAWARIGVTGAGAAGKGAAARGAPAPGSATPGRTGGAAMVVARIPDARLDWLAELHHPQKVTHATVEWIELDKLEPARIEAVHRLDALALVVRAFDPEQAHVPHPAGSVDPVRDFEQLWQDWILMDWTQVQSRIDRLRSAPSVPKAQRRDVERELEVLARCLQALEAGKPLGLAELSADERALLQGYSLVTFRPVVVAVNVDDSQAASGEFPGREALRQAARGRAEAVVPVAGRLELELAELDADSRQAFLADLGLSTPVGVERLGEAAYRACGFISFLTAGEDEVRAWTITRGTPAREAAGKIHSDIARGFIRAEVVAFEDLRRAGSLAKARETGLLRLEGKDYVVQDGDVIEFRFNV